ncbi:MAG: magnesium transporter CorA family protein [Patescibacteria group bacterium]|mgnify:CR=1 FL=1
MITHYFSTVRSRKLQILDAHKAGSWCHVVNPTKSDVEYLVEVFGLDQDILTDATDIYEAPRVETDDKATYVFTRYCHPDGDNTSTEPLLVVYTDSNIVTIMRTQDKVLDNLINGSVDILTTQKTKTFLHILEEINRSYRVQLNLVSKQILKFRSELRLAEITSDQIVRFIEIEEDLNEFLAALQPQALVLTALESGKYMRLYDDDRDMVEDIMLGTSELIELSKSRVRTVANIRQAYDVIATNNLNRTFRRLTSIAIFLTIPTIIGGLFGMNVELPFNNEGDPANFWFVLGLILASMISFISVFKYKRWI